MLQIQVGFMFQLESLGYFFDKSLNVWRREDYTNIGYNDGDEAEERLAGIIRDAKIFPFFLMSCAINALTGKRSII
jgi:hypothetical protein